MKEIWKDIEGYKSWYQVSNKGQVRSWYNGKWGKRESPKICNQFVGTHGYLTVNLIVDSNYSSILVHRVVAESFIANPKNKPCVNHIDSDKFNNRASNLEWVTYKENMSHAIKSGSYDKIIGSKNSNAKLSKNDVLEIRNAYRIGCFTQQEIANAYNICIAHVSEIVNRKKWKHI